MTRPACFVRACLIAAMFVSAAALADQQPVRDHAMTYNYFWWDGGFRAVHNEPRPQVNPDGRAHVLTPVYQLDLSRDRAAVVGFSPAPPDAPASRQFGEVVPAPEHPLRMTIRVTLDGKDYRVNHDVVADTRALMVYDSGSIAQHLRLKNIDLLDEAGQPHPDAHMEMVLVCWQDMVATTLRLIRKDNALLFAGDASITLSVEGNRPSALRLVPQGATTTRDGLTFSASGGELHLHWRLGEPPPATRVSAVQLETGQELAVTWDPLFAAHVVDMANYSGAKPYRVRVRGETDSADPAPCRILLKREGTPRLAPDGSPNEGNPRSFNVWSVYPVAFSPAGQPSGSTWQVSADSHEFENFPRPYSRFWMHLYRQGTCTAAAPLDEEVRLAWDSWAQPAAHFRQLSLLGWDDNPNFSNPRNARAVQLWVQGMIRGAEITCLSPDAYMTGNVITDIRPIDYAHHWGPNMGGGDLLRYQPAGSNKVGRLAAARADFLSYGPYLGHTRLHLTAQDDLFIGTVDAYILAANDIARTWFDCRYEVRKDVALDDLQVAFLGCPSYDFTTLSRYAWGVGDRVLNDAQLAATDERTLTWLADPVEPDSWYASYRGGILDEQKREPNGNRGMVIRAAELSLRDAPGARFVARRVSVVKRLASTTQFHINVRDGNGPIQLRRGDRLRIVFEYVPVLKYHTDYTLEALQRRKPDRLPAGAADTPARGEDFRNRVYYAILREYPDSPAAVAFEAQHGRWRVVDVQGATADPEALFPTLHLSERPATLELEGGAGFTPLRLVLPQRPASLTVTQVTGDSRRNVLTEDALAPPYQLTREGQAWIATVLLRDAADFGDDLGDMPRLHRRFEITWTPEAD